MPNLESSGLSSGIFRMVRLFRNVWQNLLNTNRNCGEDGFLSFLKVSDRNPEICFYRINTFCLLWDN